MDAIEQQSESISFTDDNDFSEQQQQFVLQKREQIKNLFSKNLDIKLAPALKEAANAILKAKQNLFSATIQSFSQADKKTIKAIEVVYPQTVKQLNDLFWNDFQELCDKKCYVAEPGVITSAVRQLNESKALLLSEALISIIQGDAVQKEALSSLLISAFKSLDSSFLELAQFVCKCCLTLGELELITVAFASSTQVKNVLFEESIIPIVYNDFSGDLQKIINGISEFVLTNVDNLFVELTSFIRLCKTCISGTNVLAAAIAETNIAKRTLSNSILNVIRHLEDDSKIKKLLKIFNCDLENLDNAFWNLWKWIQEQKICTDGDATVSAAIESSFIAEGDIGRFVLILLAEPLSETKVVSIQEINTQISSNIDQVLKLIINDTLDCKTNTCDILVRLTEANLLANSDINAGLIEALSIITDSDNCKHDSEIKARVEKTYELLIANLSAVCKNIRCSLDQVNCCDGCKVKGQFDLGVHKRNKKDKKKCKKNKKHHKKNKDFCHAGDRDFFGCDVNFDSRFNRHHDGRFSNDHQGFGHDQFDGCFKNKH